MGRSPGPAVVLPVVMVKWWAPSSLCRRPLLPNVNDPSGSVNASGEPAVSRFGSCVWDYCQAAVNARLSGLNVVYITFAAVRVRVPSAIPIKVCSIVPSVRFACM